MASSQPSPASALGQGGQYIHTGIFRRALLQSAGEGVGKAPKCLIGPVFSAAAADQQYPFGAEPFDSG